MQRALDSLVTELDEIQGESKTTGKDTLPAPPAERASRPPPRWKPEGPPTPTTRRQARRTSPLRQALPEDVRRDRCARCGGTRLLAKDIGNGAWVDRAPARSRRVSWR